MPVRKWETKGKSVSPQHKEETLSLLSPEQKKKRQRPMAAECSECWWTKYTFPKQVQNAIPAEMPVFLHMDSSCFCSTFSLMFPSPMACGWLQVWVTNPRSDNGIYSSTCCLILLRSCLYAQVKILHIIFMNIHTSSMDKNHSTPLSLWQVSCTATNIAVFVLVLSETLKKNPGYHML